MSHQGQQHTQSPLLALNTSPKAILLQDKREPAGWVS